MKKDMRNIKYGNELPRESYCDQPYIVVRRDGGWVCVMTTGNGPEGDRGQHIISTTSEDKGKTWSEPLSIEPAGPPEASWVMPLIVPSGRIYVFYTYNASNISNVLTDPGYEDCAGRVDTLGEYAYKYSDDGGSSWSDDRYYINVRNFKIDNDNPYGGKIKFFWGVGKPIIAGGSVYLGFAKVASFGEGFMAADEGVFLKSDNILTEEDPRKIRWETLPDGDTGLRAPKGKISDEHNLTSLSDGSLYCTFRSVDGYSCHAYSRDGGHTWTSPEYTCYSPGGKPVKHPRAANFVRKYGNGKYTLWFHNHGKDLTGTPGEAYTGRNPAWMCGGIEKDGYIYWSQPEIVLYDDDPDIRISYPDFIEDSGNYYITETQKIIARVHQADPLLLDGMWNHMGRPRSAEEGIISANDEDHRGRINLPALPELTEGNGISIILVINLSTDGKEKILMDTRDEAGKGILLKLTANNTISVNINDGSVCSEWESDTDILRRSEDYHIGIIIDGGPKIISFIIDGVFCDGGKNRDYGWGRFNRNIQDINGANIVYLGSEIKDIRIFGRALKTFEVVEDYRYRRNKR